MPRSTHIVPPYIEPLRWWSTIPPLVLPDCLSQTVTPPLDEAFELVLPFPEQIKDRMERLAILLAIPVPEILAPSDPRALVLLESRQQPPLPPRETVRRWREVTTTNSSLVWLVEKLRGFGFQGRMFWVAVIVVESGEVPDESDAEEEEEVVESESTFRGGSGEEG